MGRLGRSKRGVLHGQSEMFPMIPPQVNGATRACYQPKTAWDLNKFPMIPPQVNGATTGGKDYIATQTIHSEFPMIPPQVNGATYQLYAWVEKLLIWEVGFQ